MHTTVKVSLEPHTQTKGLEHLSCLLTSECESQKLEVKISRGMQTTQRKLNPLTTTKGKIKCWMPSSSQSYYLFFPHFSLNESNLSHLVYKGTEESPVPHIHPAHTVRCVAVPHR